MPLHGAGERGDERGGIELGGVTSGPGVAGAGRVAALQPGWRIGVGSGSRMPRTVWLQSWHEGGVPAGWGVVTRGSRRLGLPWKLGREWGRDGWDGSVESERACILAWLMPPWVDLDV